ncbi:hypothetical protein C1646_777451 [Rhizophagus diaphanus]|nr:hypothetical protein C1646_777451 [Rhizophagus diaphanus] [Rhizophagus sp. MUCL 43196]
MISITINFTNDIEEKSFISTKINTYNYNQIANCTNSKNSNPLEIYNCISRFYLPLKPLIDLILHFQITDLENMKNSSNPIIPIIFIPFNNDENECCYCKSVYSATLLFKQKYCKHCLILYIKCTASNNLNVQITTIDTQCSNRHKPRSLDLCIQNIQEFCISCSEILLFKQLVKNDRGEYKKKYIEKIKYCGLCGKSIYQQECLDELSYIEFKLCSDCYQISSGWLESTLTKKSIPVFYLPWWDAYNQCTTCGQFLESKTNCQKLCSNCMIIYTRCRYCLTTNIIFGIIDQSQCKKCKRMISITVNITNDIEEKNLVATKINMIKYNQIVNYIVIKLYTSSGLEFFLSRFYPPLKPLIDLISYFKITIIEDNVDCLRPIIPIVFIPLIMERMNVFIVEEFILQHSYLNKNIASIA